ncbi:hypothetical protein Poli38472_000029 [Pythium oligandrum]|uniref:Deoxyuridine 5'-triphosphate nucleotidohydrolase n=1 Tax=Pythium oligandrum TaxID=41045 RepID=A0A8K1FHQ2_PYTOL|nr:hypothetical protein Poli38472_000029 [Pythium oligandrum]|eukprot:TMW59987.1 hypothetical protein Poli38472_000029 [Pythium oligandrum]
MTRAVLRVKKLTELAIIPTRGSALAAGYDLSSAYDAVIPARGKGLVKTDLAIAVPHGCYARVAPRSGLALKKFIDTGAGVIDEDYRGNVGVVLFNHAEEDFVVSRGDRIAQLIIEKIEYADIDVVDEIDETERGAGGFGSTGVEQTLKRARQEEDVAAGAGSSISGDIVFTALEQLFASGSIDDAKRVLLKQRAFSASERQFALLRTALQEYLSKQDTAKTLEWIDAFLSSTAN